MLSFSYSALLHDYFAANDRKSEMQALEAIHAYTVQLSETVEKHGAHRSQTGDNYMVALKSEETWDSSRPSKPEKLGLNPVLPAKAQAQALTKFDENKGKRVIAGYEGKLQAPQGKRWNMNTKQQKALHSSKFSFSEDGSKLIRPFHGNPLGRMTSNTDKLAFASQEKTAKHVAMVVSGTGTNLALIQNQPLAIQLDKLLMHDQSLLRQIDKAQDKGKRQRAANLLLQLASNRQRIDDVLKSIQEYQQKLFPDLVPHAFPAYMVTTPYTAPIRERDKLTLVEGKPPIVQSKRQGSKPPKSKAARGIKRRWSKD